MSIAIIKNPDERNDPPRPLLEHLLALRDMFCFGGIAWAVCVVVAFAFSPQILSWLKSPAASSERRNRRAVTALPNNCFIIPLLFSG